MPSVSVIVPTYNRAALLRNALASVLHQTFADFELIVVDDASTDRTAEVVAAVHDSRLRYERLPARGGVSRARNRGIELACADWVAFQDSDDVWLPDKLARQHGAADDHIVLVVTRDRVLGHRELAYVRERSSDSLVDITDEASFRLPPAATWLARKEALLASGGFDALLDCYEDWELGLRLAARGRVVLVDEVLVERHKTAGSLFSDESSRRRNLRVIVERHRALLSASPQAWSYYCNALGQMAASAGDLDESRSWFRAALRAQPFTLRTWANLLMSGLGKAFFGKYVGLARAVKRRLASNAGSRERA